MAKVILYSCGICGVGTFPARELTWYFPGAEIRPSGERASPPAWYCTNCVTLYSPSLKAKGPRLDRAIIEHKKNEINIARAEPPPA